MARPEDSDFHDNSQDKKTVSTKKQKAIDITLATKIKTGIRHYFYSVAVEGRIVSKSNSFFLREGDMEFASKIVQNGNILTLIDLDFSVDKDSFWQQSIYKQLVSSSFWTFTSFFLQKLVAKIQEFGYEEVLAFHKELDSNFQPFRSMPLIASGELEWAVKKKMPASLQNEKLTNVFKYDQENRLAVKQALEKRLEDLHKIKDISVQTPILADTENHTAESDLTSGIIPNNEPDEPAIALKKFEGMLNLKNGSAENTFNYIKSRLKQANFPDNIFVTIQKTKTGANKYKLNSEIAAMVHVFQEKGYFKEEHSFKDIYKAFGIATGNSAGKDYDYSFFIDEHHFRQFKSQLTDVGIEKFGIQD